MEKALAEVAALLPRLQVAARATSGEIASEPMSPGRAKDQLTPQTKSRRLNTQVNLHLFTGRRSSHGERIRRSILRRRWSTHEPREASQAIVWNSETPNINPRMKELQVNP